MNFINQNLQNMSFNSLLTQLNIDKSEFNFQFHSHPDYPSALAFSETLLFLGIANEAYELEKEFWEEIDQDFITVFQNNMSLVKKVNGKYKLYSNETKTVDFENLKKLSTNLVILFPKGKQKKKSLKKNWLLFMLVIMLTFTIHLLTGLWNLIFFNLLSLVGVYISYEIFKEKFGDASSVLSNICGKNDSQTNSSSCEKIIFNDKTNFIGFKLSDISLLYFTSLAAAGLLLQDVQGVFFWISLLATSVILYSLYIQILIEKALCRICALIILILIGQAVIVIFTFSRTSKMAEILYIAMVFLLFFLGIKYINNVLTEKQKYKNEAKNSLRFKRNFEIFKFLLNKI